MHLKTNGELLDKSNYKRQIYKVIEKSQGYH